MTAWKELPVVQKAVAILAAVFIAGMVWAVAISEYRGLPARVGAVEVRVDTLERHHLRESMKLDRILCLAEENAKKLADRNLSRCVR